MAAKKSKDKKKGPRGKKARAKAKLEQVWGEQYDEDERLASKVRIGKSRLVNVDNDNGDVGKGINGGTKGGKKKVIEIQIDPLAKKRRGIRPSTFDNFLQRKEKYNHDVDIDKERRQFYAQQGDREESSSDDESSTSSDEEMNGMHGGVGGGSSSFATLLKRISGPSKKHKSSRDRMDIDSDDDYSDSNSDDDDDDSDSEDDEIEESDAELDQQQSDDDNEEEGSGTNTDIVVATAEDPYEQHFSRPPLPQLDSLTASTTPSSQQLVVPHTGNNRKVSTSSILKSSSIDVQISGPLLNTFDNIVTRHNSNNNSTNTNNNGKKSNKKKQSSASKATTATAKQSWNEFALGPYKHVRQVITRNWSTVNKSNKSEKKKNKMGDDAKVIFTSLQTVLYPALSRYADVLICSENRQVSSRFVYLVLFKHGTILKYFQLSIAYLTYICLFTLF